MQWEDRFYKLVPKEIMPNLRYRRALYERCRKDEDFRRYVWAACDVDILYFLNVFGWLYEPRPVIIEGRRTPRVVPFVTWPHQDVAIRQIVESLGQQDIGVEKSRGEGASWIAVYLALWEWVFHPLSAIGMVSRNEQAVDSPDDPDSLLWKLEWAISRLPYWMVGVRDKDWKRTYETHTFRNLRNGSTVVGYAATGDVASGGRKTWFVMDELAKFPRGADFEAMASTQHVTQCRLVISTPKGKEGAYYEFMHEPSSMTKVVLDWKDNPYRNRGLYRFENGKFITLDKGPLPPNYEQEGLEILKRLQTKGFTIEGRIRSPWYDLQCDRPGATPQNIAQELDRDYGGSVHRIFGEGFLEKARQNIRPPLVRGTILLDPETKSLMFDHSPSGNVLLWTRLDSQNKPPMRRYIVGVDVSSGLGGQWSSNSVAQVIDLETKEQVLEYATNTVGPAEFADECIAIANWFHEAFLVWEQNGPGAAFSQRVIERGYGNIYYRTILWKRGGKRRKEVGWWTDERTKEALFGELARAVRSGELITRSEALVREFGEYVRQNGRIEHLAALKTTDDSAKGKAHGDRVVAIGMCLQGAKQRLVTPYHKEPELLDPPQNTLAWREQQFQKAMREKDDVWDDRTIADMMYGESLTYRYPTEYTIWGGDTW